jgi:hypothetical protein
MWKYWLIMMMYYDMKFERQNIIHSSQTNTKILTSIDMFYLIIY